MKALLIATVLFASTISALYVQEKKGIQVRIHDLSIQSERNLVGYSIGQRKIKELTGLGIHPLLIEIINDCEKAYTISSNSFSVPILSKNDLVARVPFTSSETLFAAWGALAALFGAGGGSILSLFVIPDIYEKSSKSTFSWKSNWKSISIPVVTTLLWYSMYKGFSYASSVSILRKKDQADWLKECTLPTDGGAFVIPPHSEIKRYVFLDKEGYASPVFKLALREIAGDDLIFDVSILP